VGRATGDAAEGPRAGVQAWILADDGTGQIAGYLDAWSGVGEGRGAPRGTGSPPWKGEPALVFVEGGPSDTGELGRSLREVPFRKERVGKSVMGSLPMTSYLSATFRCGRRDLCGS